MLPRYEVSTLTRLTLLAFDLASMGNPGEGYTCLVEGSCRARTLRDAGEPWGDELLVRYRETMDDYARRYQIARE